MWLFLAVRLAEVDGYHSTVSDGFAALHKVRKEPGQSPILLLLTFHAVALSLSQESIPIVTPGFALVVTPRGREMPRLNASFVKTTKAVGRFGDGRGGYGLALLVRPRAGGGVRKSWTQRVRVGGRATNLGLGQYPLVELAEARAKAHPSPALRRQTQLGTPRNPHSDLKREAPYYRSWMRPLNQKPEGLNLEAVTRWFVEYVTPEWPLR